MSSMDVEASNVSLTRTAAGLALAGVALMVVLAVIDHDGGGWLVQPVLGLAAAITAWRAGGSSPKKNLIAFLALLIGVILVVVFLGFVIAEA
jgi:FtsH-binding integral membrane protein